MSDPKEHAPKLPTPPSRRSHQPPLQPRDTAAVLQAGLQSHYDDFRRYLMRRVGDPATAEDILQSFCIRVMQSETKLRDEKSALGWLFTVLRSVLMDHFRKEAVRLRGDARYAQEQMILTAEPVLAEAEGGMCTCLTGLLPELRPEYGDVLRRIDFIGEPREQVARDLQISAKNLRVRLHRARQAIEVALKHHCGACCETQYRDCFCDRGEIDALSNTADP